MKKVSFFLFCFIPFHLFPQNFNASLIPDSLKLNADVVKRYEEIDFEIKSPSKATMHQKDVYTILNEKAYDFANYVSSYDDFSSINYIDGILYDENGKELKHVKKKDMADESGSSEQTLMTDTRYKVNKFYYSSYPFTVYYDEEDDINGLLGIDRWLPVSKPNMSVQFSKYVITAPKAYELRYKQFNFPEKPVITQSSDKIIYTWQIQNAAAVSEEKMEPAWREIVPNIMFAPSDFEAQGYKGNMSSWLNFGKFIQQLKEGKDILPNDIKTQVHNLTDNISDEKQKIYALYNFLQQNTRYISVQLGIGGLQPFDAGFVATKKYGDCKALSNYMVALLKEAGIKANYVAIRSGSDAPPIVEDFPALSQFDHVICCVPMKKDTMWLECTNQSDSPGFMGSFTGDRKGLLIDDDGGHLVNTPVYSASDNLQYRTVNAVIDETGNLDASIQTKYTGIQAEIPHSLINEATKEQRERYLNYEFNLPTYQVEQSNYTETKAAIPSVYESLRITSQGYANVSGRRMFISPDLFNKSAGKLSEDSARKFDIVYDNAFKDVDSIILKIPDGYTPEFIPQNLSSSNKFGTYNIIFKIEGNIITCIRTQIRSRSRFPAADYKDFVAFTNSIYKTDRSKIVLIKKEN